MENTINEATYKGSFAKKVIAAVLSLMVIAAGAIYFSEDNDDPENNGSAFPQCPPKCAVNPY